MWQHMQGVMGFLITSLLQIYLGIFQWKNLVDRLILWQNCGHQFVASLVWPTLYIERQISWSAPLLSTASAHADTKSHERQLRFALCVGLSVAMASYLWFINHIIVTSHVIFSIKFSTERIFRIFLTLKNNRMTAFCDLGLYLGPVELNEARIMYGTGLSTAFRWLEDLRI